jgi:hypothetical protein
MSPRSTFASSPSPKKAPKTTNTPSALPPYPRTFAPRAFVQFLDFVHSGARLAVFDPTPARWGAPGGMARRKTRHPVALDYRPRGVAGSEPRLTNMALLRESASVNTQPLAFLARILHV